MFAKCYQLYIIKPFKKGAYRFLKYLSKTLKRTYTGIILLFVFVFLGAMFMTGRYIINVSKLRMKNSMSFLQHEIGETKKSETINIFIDNDKSIDDFKRENKDLLILGMIFKYKDYFYATPGYERYINYPLHNGKFSGDNFYNYLVYRNVAKNIYGEKIEVTLIKNLRDERKIVFNIFYIFVLFIVIGLIVSSTIVNRILNKINFQLKSLALLNSHISLDNLQLEKPNNQFIEFENIWISYEEMISRLDQQNKQQIEFVHNASHELKTPLFIIGGYMDMIKRWGHNDPKILEESIGAVDDEVKNMKGLIEKLLFIAKEGSLNLDIQEIEISELILELIGNLKIIYPSCKINFHPEYILLESDYNLISLLVRNILENSIKYGQDKEINIFLEEKEENILIKIQDNGMGMDEETLKNVYNRFYRGDKSHNKNIKGHGLGMAIVQKIIQMLNGEISIHSKLNEGTTVILKLKKLGTNF